MYDWDLQVAPAPPGEDLQRGVLEVWLRNPFIDDDVAELALRLGAPEGAVADALRALCAGGFLRRTGRGHALALDLGGTTPVQGATMAGPAAAPQAAEAQSGGATTPADGAAVGLASLSGAVAIDPEADDAAAAGAEDLLSLLAAEPADDAAALGTEDLLSLLAAEPADDAAAVGTEDLLSLLAADPADALDREIEQTLGELLPAHGFDEEQLIEALPFGLLVLTPLGTRELANRRAADLLGVAPQQLDGATFELLTGVNPLVALDRDEPLCFSLTEPQAIEVSLSGRHLPSGTVILAMIRDVSLLEEVSQIQAETQEELFQRLRVDMVDPLMWIERFLEAPDPERLVQARIAMEHINGFLQEFFLRGPGRDPDRS